MKCPIKNTLTLSINHNYFTTKYIVWGSMWNSVRQISPQLFWHTFPNLTKFIMTLLYNYSSILPITLWAQKFFFDLFQKPAKEKLHDFKSLVLSVQLYHHCVKWGSHEIFLQLSNYFVCSVTACAILLKPHVFNMCYLN